MLGIKKKIIKLRKFLFYIGEHIWNNFDFNKNVNFIIEKKSRGISIW